MTYTIILDTKAAKQRAIDMIAAAQYGLVFMLKERARTTEQNDRMWAMLTDVSRQCRIHGQKYPPETWKALAMEACGHKPRVVPSLSGDGVVITGYKSSRLSVGQMSELIEYLFAYGAEKGVQWSNERSDDVSD